VFFRLVFYFIFQTRVGVTGLIEWEGRREGTPGSGRPAIPVLERWANEATLL